MVQLRGRQPLATVSLQPMDLAVRWGKMHMQGGIQCVCKPRHPLDTEVGVTAQGLGDRRGTRAQFAGEFCTGDALLTHAAFQRHGKIEFYLFGSKLGGSLRLRDPLLPARNLFIHVPPSSFASTNSIAPVALASSRNRCTSLDAPSRAGAVTVCPPTNSVISRTDLASILIYTVQMTAG